MGYALSPGIIKLTGITPKMLRDSAGAGFNAIWIHAILRDIVRSPVFPEQAIYSPSLMC